MNLIVEFDLQHDTTDEQVEEFVKFLESFPKCNGTYMHTGRPVPPLPFSGRVSFDSPTEHEEHHLQYLFGQLKIVRNYEAQWEAPAVL